MEPRRGPVDWDELKLALEMRSEEWASHLDVRTGEIRVSRIDPFGGCAEDHELVDEEIEAGLADGTLIAVEPLESSVEYAWMADFADAVPDVGVRRSLQQALVGVRPFRRFKDALTAHPHERAQWSHSAVSACGTPSGSGSPTTTSSRRLSRRRGAAKPRRGARHE